VELLIQELVVLVQRSEEYTGFMAARSLNWLVLLCHAAIIFM
jgi:hypothetical protein